MAAGLGGKTVKMAKVTLVTDINVYNAGAFIRMTRILLSVDTSDR